MSHLRFYHDFVAQLYRATKLQHASVMSHRATLSHKQEITNQLGQCLFVRQSSSVLHDRCMLQLCRAVKLRDKIAR